MLVAAAARAEQDLGQAFSCATSRPLRELSVALPAAARV